MALTHSTMLAIGTKAPDFSLPDSSGKIVALKNFPQDKPLLVLFICNHCPYVIHIRDELARITTDYQRKGISIIGINSNDVKTHPEDRPEKMAQEILSICYTFPYLFDESQNVAKSYHAACTPDFFLFDSAWRLAYRGQMDESRPGSKIPVSGKDLRNAMDQVLSGKPCHIDQKPSMGCNIKWRLGNEPTYSKSICSPN